MPEVVGTHIDRVVTVEIRRRGAFNRGVVVPLYEAARRAQGDRPLALLAAERLRAAVPPGSYVLILTGSGRPPWRPRGETDGPVGAASMARAIKLGLGGRPVYVAAEPYMPPVIAAGEGLGLTGVTDRAMAEYDGFYPTALVRPFPLDPTRARATAVGLLDDLQPSAVIAIETLAPNAKGVIHSATGFEREPQHVAHSYHVIEEARRRGILAVGVGDFGNECGMGLIAEAVGRINPFGTTCKCPCGAGVAAAVATDVLMVAAISNWGGYAISAALAYLLGNPDVLESPVAARRSLEECVAAGAEGEGGMRQPWVDGTPVETQVSVVTLLRTIVENALKPPLERGW
jgi:hypothetical protein